MIAPLERGHVRDVARLHCASLTGLLSELGEPAARAFYFGCIGSRSARAFVDIEAGAIRGFVLGSLHPVDLKREVMRRKFFSTFTGLTLGVLRKPLAFVSLMKSLKGPDEGSYDARAAELTYLAVPASGRNAGTGRRLVEAFNGSMRESAVSSYELSVDDDNAGAAIFYEKLGFNLVGHYSEFGVVHRRYRLALD